MLPSLLPHPSAQDELLGSTLANINHLHHSSHSSPALEALASMPLFSRTPSTSKSRSTTKCGVQEHFSEDAMRKDEILERLRLQKHEQMITSNDVKRHKLKHKLLEVQHQHEQHELHMLQMRLMMQGGQRAASMMQSPVGIASRTQLTAHPAHPA